MGPEPAARAGGEGVVSSGSPVNQEAETLRLLLALPHEIEIDAATAARWIEWGLTADQADELGRIARQRKPIGPIPIKYLETIIQGEFLNNPHLIPAPDRRRRHAQRPVTAERLTPAEIVAAALRAESESGGFVEGGCEIVH